MTQERPSIIDAILDRELSHVERVVLAYLAWRQGINGEAWPSQRTIADDLALTCDGVRKITQRLEAKNRLRVIRPDHTAPGKLLRYQITPTAVGAIDANRPDGCLGSTPTAVGANTPTAVSRNYKGKRTRTRQQSQRRSFEPPTVEAVAAYATERGRPDFDAEKFVAYYAAGDWHDSKGNPVRNWKQRMISTWLKPENGKRVECATREASDEEAEQYRRITAAYQGGSAG